MPYDLDRNMYVSHFKAPQTCSNCGEIGALLGPTPALRPYMYYGAFGVSGNFRVVTSFDPSVSHSLSGNS